MKKRIRKKKCMGEFQELGFSLEAKISEMSDEANEALFNAFIERAKSLELACFGSWSEDELSLEIETGRIGTDNEERRTKLLEFIAEHPEFTDMTATDLYDVIYSSDSCECGCDHDHGCDCH